MSRVVEKYGFDLTEDQLWDSLLYPQAVFDAKRFAEDRMDWIKRYGGQRSRMDGIHWLRRIIKRHEQICCGRRKDDVIV